MDYGGKQVGNDFAQAGNAYQTGQLGAISSAQGMQTAAAPRTVASAIGRIDGLNDRLSKISAQLSGISDQIGGPRNVAGQIRPTDPAPSPANAVSRLNDSADCAHNYLSEIEGMLSSIGRALG